MLLELWRSLWKLSLLGAFVVFNALVSTFNDRAVAQIVPDNTLGDESSLVTPNSNVRGLPATLIEGGATRGVNLFQSFSQFNVGDGQRVYFANPTGIDNILTRVTGNSVSNIFGTLGVDGNANLFFLNPNGIVFGENASLDVAGSFLATTADGFDFGNGLGFSANNPQAAPLLSVSVTPGLQFGSNAGNISNTGNLSVGQGLTLAGGNLDLLGQMQAGKDVNLQAQDTVKIRDSAASAFVASAGENLTVQGNEKVDIFALNNANSGLFSGGDMVLRSANTVGGDTHYSTGGNFKIENLNGSLGGLFSPYYPVIRASGDVYFDFYQGASLHILAGGSVKIPGSVWIQGSEISNNSLAETITTSDGSTVSIDGSAEPTLDIRAGTTAFGAPFFNTGNPSSADIKLGTIIFADPTSNFITGRVIPLAGKILLTNQYEPNSSLAGNIEIAATQEGIFTNRAILNSGFLKGGSVAIDSRADVKVNGIINTDTPLFNGNYFGNGGNVSLLAKKDITLSSGSAISSTGLLGGNITLKSGETTSLTNSAILSKSYISVSDEKGGDINVTAKTLSLSNSRLNTDTSGKANAGNIAINADDAVNLTNSAQLRTDTYGIGNAGKITIDAKGAVTFDGLSRDQDGKPIENPSPSFFSTGVASQVGSLNPDPQKNIPGFGQGGDIEIKAHSLNLKNGAALSSTTYGGESFNPDGTIIYKNAGNITITVDDAVNLTNGAQIRSDTYGIGNAGKITIDAKGAVTFDGLSRDQNGKPIENGSPSFVDTGTGVASQVGSLNSDPQKDIPGFGQGGDIEIKAHSLNLKNGAALSNITYGGESFNPDGTIIYKNAGNITINADDAVNLTNGGQLRSDTFGIGNAGNITVNGENAKVTFDGVSSGIQSDVQPLKASIQNFTGNRKAGNITVNAREFSLTGAVLSSSTSGIGNAGNISIQAKTGTVSLNDAQVLSTVESGAKGSAGIISIDSKSIELNDNTELQTVIRASEQNGATGNGGVILISATDSISLNNSGIFGTIEQGATVSDKLPLNPIIESIYDNLDDDLKNFIAPRSGFILLQAKKIELKKGSSINSSTFGLGDAGSIIIDAKGGNFDGLKRDENSGAVELTNGSVIAAVVVTGGKGNGGNIEINSNTLSLKDGSQVGTLVSRTFQEKPGGIGNAGNININATNSVTLSGISPQGFSSGLLTLSERGASGNAGNVDVKTGDFKVENGAIVTAATFNDGGDAKKITIKANNVELTNGGQIITNTRSSRNAGDIKLDVANNITISGSESNYDARVRLVEQDIQNTGSSDKVSDRIVSYFDEKTNSSPSGIFANTAEGSTGQGGNINIDPELVTIKDGAIIAVDSQGSGQAGNLALTSNRLILDEGKITAATNTTNGGNITLNLQDLLLLRENSKISATAGQQGGTGDGGNVTINAPSGFVVALQDRNNDIVARASGGKGGEINIEAQSIFGLAERSSQPPNQTNDIDASSDLGPQFNGIVQLNTPDVDPASAINTLPQNVIDPSNQIDQGCAALDEDNTGEFRVIGRGGLPPSPDQPLSSNTVWEDTRTTTTAPQKLTANTTAKTPKAEANKITPATAWVFNKNGEVTLISSASKTTPEKLGTTPKSCPTR